eukprot:CAMPEP_0177379368 /NCGR_PEP_ID=MMETSP0368-20130122/46885_1 /TAXON_ID=447022 ORGANISM="Scrippsiella hangoei-like, Strain SHHI-4" /NCGR_SAMPLE_ID=MMETSP0368 /ASSEMBLY_ACC=CAM_ASM_000363 /LENGTH=88 /DNA_ID=CAMNT_0018843489 /DNA_START=293 /DNA_END=562 /DNA_ORIENTATION=+
MALSKQYFLRPWGSPLSTTSSSLVSATCWPKSSTTFEWPCSRMHWRRGISRVAKYSSSGSTMYITSEPFLRVFKNGGVDTAAMLSPVV